jgi:hypothetical protein
MWRLCLCVCFYLCGFQLALAQSSPQRVTRLQLRQVEQAGETDFIVTTDSLLVQKRGLISGKDSQYQRPLTPQERN